MRYVALKRLTYTGPDGAVYAILPGQGVPGFETWSSGVRHANLASNMVRDTEALAPTVVGQGVRMVCYGRVDAGAAVAEPGLVAKAEAAVAQDALHPCPHCDHKGFAVKNSLMQHIKRKH